MEITLRARKEDVMEQVAQTTAYTGSKMTGEDSAGAWERISTVEEDGAHMERFWGECRADICRELRGLVAGEGFAAADSAGSATGGGTLYEVRLEVSAAFDTALLPSMELGLEGYLVNAIAARWYVYTNKKEAGDYALKAQALLEDLHRKAVYKKRPMRPTYS